MARKWLPDNVTRYQDRHGKWRYRFRKKGLPTYSFRNPPGTEGFREEYQRASNAEPKGKLPRFAPFTYDALIASFYETPRWLRMADSSKATYRGIIERFRARNGSKDVRGVDIEAIDKLLAKRAAETEHGAAAANLRKVLSRLHRHAIKLKWRIDNPVSESDVIETTGKGWHTWTEDEIAAFEKRWPLGTRQRLAMALLLYTALRRSDMIRLGRQHIRNGQFELHHTKNDSKTVLPIDPECQKAIDALPTGNMTFLVTERGHPYSSGNSFFNWFKRACKAAGIPHCGPHGLRKAMSRRLAESGATTLQGRAVTGHKTDREFNHYAEQANQGDLAKTAMANLSQKFAKEGE